MKLETYSEPVRHLVSDGFVQPQDDWTVPAADWSGWEARYDNDCERGKRTARSGVAWAGEVLSRMHELGVLRACAHFFAVAGRPDPLLWGGGLHVTEPGGWLNAHLDGVVHPKRPGLRRAIQLVCFCNREWKKEWGGSFAFFSPDGSVVKEVEPVPGRLLAFESSDLSYHGVLPVAGDAAERVTVTTSLLDSLRECDTRARALFMPSRR